MRILLLLCLTISVAYFSACKSSSGPASFCDTACLKDSIKFTGDHFLNPSVTISAANCMPDSISWTYDGMGVHRKSGFTYLLNNTVNLNKNFVRCFFNDTAYAWVIFNDCVTGRGYQLKLPYNKSQKFSIKSSGINNFDPKFSVDPSLIVSTDRGNLYVEDLMTGKKAMMTFGQKLDIDYDALHEYIDSVNVNPSHIWVKVKIANKWEELQKNITLE